MRSTTLAFVTASLAGVLASSALADVGFRIANNQLVTWNEDDDAPPGENWVAPSRIFDGDLAVLGGNPTTNEPGFNGEDGTLTGFHLGFNILKAARVWNTSSQAFDSISPLTVTLSSALVGSVTTPATDTTVSGPNVLVPEGDFDFHYDYDLNGSAPGIYLLEMQITTDKPGIASSLPYWVTLNYGLGESEHEAANQWVAQNLVPAPSSLALLGLVAFGASRRRR